MSQPKTNTFQFKQFAVDQTGCAMKVNTDGVLLGALVTAKDPKSILDIGTGTGMIALMLAQRFPMSIIDAVEIDKEAAETAKNNFYNSPFSDRCTCFSKSFEQYFAEYPDKTYDLIISNPPFFINSLKSSTAAKEIARHTTLKFFSDLLAHVKVCLNENGRLSLILPVETADMVTKLALDFGFCLLHQIKIASFKDSESHRKIVSFEKEEGIFSSRDVVIYAEPKSYTEEYARLLRDFLTIF
ncbi:MAG TPA: methyltransferase [Sphingobacteriaceae bacterium]